MTDQQDVAAVDGYAEMTVDTLLNLASPQPSYRDMIEQGGIASPADGIVMVFNRELSDFVLRHHELFSSHIDMPLGNVRPLIPLNIDPPKHSKYRKLMDPLFSPKRMDEQEADITRRVNEFIDAFVDRGECNFTEEFAELFPSSVFLGLMGLPGQRPAHDARPARRRACTRRRSTRTRCSTSTRGGR